MLIFIEGCDRTGKSTLSKKLSEFLDCPITHCSKPGVDPLGEYMRMIVDKGLDQGNAVFDRGYLGEYVYANLWRGGCTIQPQDFRMLDKMAAKFGGIIIHATAETSDIIERCKKDGEALLKMEDIDNCKGLFDEIISHSVLPRFIYNSSTTTTEEFFHLFASFYKGFQ